MSVNLLVIGDPQSLWCSALSTALASLGYVRLIGEKEVDSDALQTHYDLIIMDAASVKEVTSLVQRLRILVPEARIIVATLSPTWQRARAALRAGAVSYVRRSENVEEFLSIVKEFLPKSYDQGQAEE